jgi:hypothetical protein
VQAWAIAEVLRAFNPLRTRGRLFDRLHSILSIREQIDTHHLNLDGSHAPAKKGGEAVAYQGTKKAKTSKILPIKES